jgi:hypothetical protein
MQRSGVGCCTPQNQVGAAKLQSPDLRRQTSLINSFHMNLNTTFNCECSMYMFMMSL